MYDVIDIHAWYCNNSQCFYHETEFDLDECLLKEYWDDHLETRVKKPLCPLVILFYKSAVI